MDSTPFPPPHAPPPSSPQLTRSSGQIMQDPAAMAKMQMQMAEQEKEGGGGGTAPAGPEVPQAEFKEDK
eukprot:1051515-Rhodomonas_salina.1